MELWQFNKPRHCRGITRLGLSWPRPYLKVATQRSSRSRLHFQRSVCIKDLDHEPWVLVVSERDGARNLQKTHSSKPSHLECPGLTHSLSYHTTEAMSWISDKTVFPRRGLGSGLMKSIDTIWNGLSDTTLHRDDPLMCGLLLLVLQSSHAWTCLTTSSNSLIQKNSCFTW